MSSFADVTEKPINKKTIAEKSNKKLLDLKAHTCFSEKKKEFQISLTMYYKTAKK